MRSLLAAIVLSVALLNACAPGDDLARNAQAGPPFHFDISTAPVAYWPWFIDAADQWNIRENRILLVIDGSGPNRILFEDPLVSGVASTTCDATQCIIRIMPISWAQCDVVYSLRRTAMHEFGHVLGSYWPDNPTDPRHSPNPLDLMYAAPHGCGDITDRDAASIGY